ncbi:lipase family protein [Rhodococcus sp. UNC363MFTsu5.1]|uniref:lipase family protein n=1 Tax=Rhodococcus sp. UNC363MFTsu5.1 TaxID=1449069 RepID=UPI0009DD7A35|nr:lipase family protein [Rhodococcus sp. UNC363MFTsu5.1]
MPVLGAGARTTTGALARRTRRGVIVCSTAIALAVSPARATAAAQTAVPPPPGTGLPAIVDSIVPPPALGPPPREVPPIAAAAGEPSEIQALRIAVMPSDVGDPFFDRWPDSLGDSANGDVLEMRDVTAAAAPLVGVAVREVRQIKVRTTDAVGVPSYATATLIIPARPWTGAGGRPVLVNNLPIDALGRACTPGYTLAHGLNLSTNVADFVPPTTALAALHGYAVLIPDHEGPRMAYAEPYVAGHAVLDTIRGLHRALPDEFGASKFAMTGYSGGAIATEGAVKLIDSYAPDLAGAIVGAALGGVPANFEMLTRSMNGNLATGLFHGATLGIARERTEILALANNLAQQLATSPLKDQCVVTLGAAGVTFLPIEVMADIDNPLASPQARELYRVTKMAGMASGTPLYIYNGAQEFWIPAAGARELYLEQCGLGVPAVYREVFGEHLVAAVTGYPGALHWLDDRLRGVPAPDECPPA